MVKYIYKITSPSKKIYIGQSTILFEQKYNDYQKCELYTISNRKIIKAIKKHKWKNMLFEIIEQNDQWTKQELNDQEIFWINYYDSVNTGYNMTIGGDGVDSECARKLATIHHATMSEEKKQQRKENCSKGQQKRFQENPDSEITKKRKSDSHKGSYKIESPDGRIWETNIGLKEFAEKYKDEIQIGYWQLFNAYRRCYNNKTIARKRKDNNRWKVIRIDK